MDAFLRAAIAEARAGLAEGGIPIDSVLVIDGKIVGRGHNRRVQKVSAVLHAEMDASKTPDDSRPPTTGAPSFTRRSLPLRHVQRSSPPLQDPDSRHWREPLVPRSGGVCPLSRRGPGGR